MNHLNIKNYIIPTPTKTKIIFLVLEVFITERREVGGGEMTPACSLQIVYLVRLNKVPLQG